jgi:DNA-binding MarR family transcriptional regulator/ribosomal protein L40E
MDSLSEKYSNLLLSYLLSKEKFLKTDLQVIVTNIQTLDKLLNKFQNDNLIKIEKKIIGRRTFEISLTDKGRRVAEQLKKAQEIANSPTIEIKEMDDLDLTMTDEEAEMAKHLNLLFHINVMDDHITVEEVKPGKPSRIFNIYVKRNGNGEFRLWCEHDDSYDCWHVKAAWTYPHVQKMMMHYKGKVKVCPSCGYEDPEAAKFCMNCAAKLE